MCRRVTISLDVAREALDALEDVIEELENDAAMNRIRALNKGADATARAYLARLSLYAAELEEAIREAENESDQTD